MPSAAPELESILRKIAHGVVNYCVICLRTDSERFLMKNNAFNKFSEAVNLDDNMQEHFICHMCERQAANALKFYKAAKFASAIHKIFQQILSNNRGKKLDVESAFEGWKFNAVLMKLKLVSKTKSKTYPLEIKEWEEELIRIRKMTTLTETKTLLVDSDGATVAEPDSTDLYVVPDNVPLSNAVTQTTPNLQQNSSQRSPNESQRSPNETQSSLNNSQSSLNNSQSSPNNSKTTQKSNKRSQRKRTANKKYLNDFICEKKKIDKKSPEKPPQENSLLLNYLTSGTQKQDAETSETLVILDDEEDKHDPLRIRIEKVRSEAPPATPIKGAPKLVPIEKLLEPKPAEPLILPTEPNFMLHPIIMNPQGLFMVPTIAIDNGFVINQCADNSLNDLVQRSQNEVSQRNVSKRKQNFENMREVTVDAYNRVVASNDFRNDENNDYSVATPNKKSCSGLPVISEVRSEIEAPKKDSIDWEDKIPMDVITFLDAVDPNCPIKPTSMGPSIGLSNVIQSLQPPSNVIDLC